jgi:hypothetical protein
MHVLVLNHFIQETEHLCIHYFSSNIFPSIIQAKEVSLYPNHYLSYDNFGKNGGHVRRKIVRMNSNGLSY